MILLLIDNSFGLSGVCQIFDVIYKPPWWIHYQFFFSHFVLVGVLPDLSLKDHGIISPGDTLNYFLNILKNLSFAFDLLKYHNQLYWGPFCDFCIVKVFCIVNPECDQECWIYVVFIVFFDA